MDDQEDDQQFMLSASDERRRRFLRFAAIFAACGAILAALAYWFFLGWRARDLALKARANLENANYRFAWLQADSARNLRADDPEVLRTSAIVDAAFGRKESLDAWRRLAALQKLTPDDEEQRARAAMRFGDEAQFSDAVAALEAAGKKEAAARLRAASKLTRGDLQQALEEARRGSSFSDDPRLRLDLAKLLLRRYVDDLAASPAQGSPARLAFAEMTSIVNSLQGDPEVGLDALAFGLTFLLPGPETQKAWADAAMARLEPGNPALLPAATVMIDSKYGSPEELHTRLEPVFSAAPLERRAAYAAWLSRHGLAREALDFVSAEEAGKDPKAFVARTEALGKSGYWAAVIATAEAGGNVPQSLLLLTKAKAQYASNSDPASGATYVGVALRAAANEQALPGAIQAADEFGAQSAVNDALVELSGDPAFAATAFRLARERFAKAGDHARMKAAFARAQQVAPGDTAVRDYARYTSMMSEPGKEPDVAGATRDAELAPSDPLLRVTQALAHLRAGQPEAGLGVFDDITVFYDRLPPGHQAVICALLAANGRSGESLAMARAIDVSKLDAGERELIGNLR